MNLKLPFYLLLLSVNFLYYCQKNDQLILIDGSSTVYPISEAVAEEFLKISPGGTTIAIGESGTGGGFAKLARGEIDISNASRPISKEEFEQCRNNHIEFIEIPVAYDGIAIVVHPENDWVDTMTVKELKQIWEPGAQGKIIRWNQIRPEWPDREIHLYGAGVSSGTFDYFTEAIVGIKKASRGDYTASEDDNVLVQGVSHDILALGYFGLAYYEENKQKLKALGIDDLNDRNGTGAIMPSFENVRNATYQPLTRPEFIYVSLKAASRPATSEFIHFYLTEGTVLVEEVGYVSLSSTTYHLAWERFNKKLTGSLLVGQDNVGVDLEKLLNQNAL